MTEREAPPDWGFEHRPSDPYEDDGWFGREQVAAPVPVPEAPDSPRTQPIDVVRDEPVEAPREVTPAPAPTPRRHLSPAVSTWTVNGQLRATDNSTLTFRAAPPPWYRTKPARIALIAVACAAVAVPIVLLVLPDNSSTGPGESTSVAPQPSTTAQPTPTSALPPPVNAPPPLPPPPPPPPPTADTGSASSQPYWTPEAPAPTQKPDIGVTRTPVTRAPISVAPQPRQAPETAETGEGRKGFHCGGWC